MKWFKYLKNWNKKSKHYLKRSAADFIESTLSKDIVDCNVRWISKFFSVPAVRARIIRRCKKPRALFWILVIDAISFILNSRVSKSDGDSYKSWNCIILLNLKFTLYFGNWWRMSYGWLLSWTSFIIRTFIFSCTRFFTCCSSSGTCRGTSTSSSWVTTGTCDSCGRYLQNNIFIRIFTWRFCFISRQNIWCR